jgi:hypothetical protein
LNVRHLSLELLNGPLDGITIRLDKPTMIGRTVEGPLAFEWDKQLQPRHALFDYEKGVWLLVPTDSTSVCRCPTRELTITERTPLEDGDVLRIGSQWLLVALPANLHVLKHEGSDESAHKSDSGNDHG